MRQHCRSENVLYSYVRRLKHSEDNCHWAAALEASRRHAPAENNDASVAITSTHGGDCPAFASWPEGRLGTAARLEADNRGEVFACLFQAHAVLSHQACASGSVFFCCRLPKAGLSGYARHPWLVPDPDSQPRQVPGRAGTRTGMTGRDPEATSQKAGFYM